MHSPSSTVRSKVMSIFNTIRKSYSPCPQAATCSKSVMDVFYIEREALELDDHDASLSSDDSDSIQVEKSDEEDGSKNGLDEDERTHNDDQKDSRWKAPPVSAALKAYSELQRILRPTGNGYKHANLDDMLRRRLEGMSQFLWNYTDPNSPLMEKWIASSLDTARRLTRGPWYARHLREWCCAFIENPENLPLNIYGTWNKSKLDDEDFQQEITSHLQSIGKYVCGMDLVRFTENPDVQKRFGLKKAISLRTAQYWMNMLGYRWTLEPSGQYVDGHEREDVVNYRQNNFLPKWKEIEPNLRAWTADGREEYDDGSSRPWPQRTVAWFHDESTFYAHDRRRRRWVHKTEKAVPRQKGEGVSVMVADFVSADYGWLRSPDGKEKACVIFKAGKTRDGYFTNNDITKQLDTAIDIINKHYPNDNHIFIFDNATTHLKRDENALSARKMTKGPSKTFGIDVTVVIDNKVQYQQDGKPLKKRVRMGPGKFANGEPQDFYYGSGQFKGMTKILEERRKFDDQIPANLEELRGECKGFKCIPASGVQNCCQRRILFNQPDFQDQESMVEKRARERGYTVMFLPKFHCELNFIEQCWCHAKRRYREYPPSSKEEDVERNMVAALESVTVEVMRK